MDQEMNIHDKKLIISFDQKNRVTRFILTDDPF